MASLNYKAPNLISNPQSIAPTKSYYTGTVNQSFASPKTSTPVKQPSNSGGGSSQNYYAVQPNQSITPASSGST
jgi:hypothetical protein